MSSDLLCTMDGCDRRRHARGLCNAHYKQWYKDGGKDSVAAYDNQAKKAWLIEAARITEDVCADYPWGSDALGYGMIADFGRSRGAHILVCEIVHGPRPAGMQAAHRCGRPPCCSGAHLRWATPSENAHDRTRHRASRHMSLAHEAEAE